MQNYSHDCTKCIFLGSYDDADLYYHRDDFHPTIIARFSDEPSDYISGIIFGKEPMATSIHKHLRVAYLIAQDLGYRFKRGK